MLTVQELVDDNADKIPSAGSPASAAGPGHPRRRHGRRRPGRPPEPDPPSRIQVFGQEELAYYTRFDLRRRMHHMDELLIGGVPAILLADGLTPPQDLIDQCAQHQVPLLSTPVAAAS